MQTEQDSECNLKIKHINNNYLIDASNYNFDIDYLSLNGHYTSLGHHHKYRKYTPNAKPALCFRCDRAPCYTN